MATEAVARDTTAMEAAMEAEEEVEEFNVIDKLEALGINKGDIKKARDAGFNTCEALLQQPSKVLAEIKGLSDAKIGKMLEAGRQLCPRFVGFTTARQVEEQRHLQVCRISTGCAALDAVLGGGLETKLITECFGEWRTGKTQLAYTMAVTCQINTKMPGKVCFIDTEGGFHPERLRPIAERYGVDPDAVLDNVLHARAYNFEHQMALLEPLAAKMAEEQFKLVIMDSITALFRSDFTGRGELAERQQRLGQLMHRLRKLADEFNVAIFLTNQVLSDPSGGAMFVSDPKKAAGGHVMAHASHVRLSVRKGKGEQRVAKLVQAPHLPEAEASYAITAAGVGDYKD